MPDLKPPLNPRIQAKLDTQHRHASMFGKTISLKLQQNKISTSQLNALNLLFSEANNFSNFCISHLKLNNSLDSFSTTQTKIPVHLHNDKVEMRDLKILSSQMKQAIKDRIYSNHKATLTSNSKIKTQTELYPTKTSINPKTDLPYSSTQLKHILNSKPDKHGKPSLGFLNFKTECNSIPLKQFNVTYKLFNQNKYVKIQNVKQNFKLIGFKQIPEGADLCNATLSRHHGCFYLNIYCYIPHKPKNVRIQQTDIPEGIDFGMDTQITTSSGLKISWNLPVNSKIKAVNKKIFRRRSKKIKIPVRGKYNRRIRNRASRPDSNNKTKDLAKRKKLYHKLDNQKLDIKNKVVSYLTSRFATIVMQDDSIKAWQTGGMGKKIQGTGLGWIKSALLNKAATSIMIPQHYASSKTCSNCGCKKKTLARGCKIYECSICNFRCCRDINGATSTLHEGLKLGEKTLIQMNAKNSYHVGNEKDMKRESDRVKQLAGTKAWVRGLAKKVSDMNTGSSGADDELVHPSVLIKTDGCTGRLREETAAGSLVVREIRSSCSSTT